MFEDGTVWQRATFETLAARNVATVGDDALSGTTGADVLEGLEGDDVLSGGVGNDTYVFRRGDGRDVIRDAGGGVDRIEIGGYAAGEVAFDRRGSNGDDLVIRLGSEGETITVINGYLPSETDRIEQIVLTDTAETFLIDDIRAGLLTGDATNEDDQIIGTDLDNTIGGSGGADLLIGGGAATTHTPTPPAMATTASSMPATAWATVLS